MKCKYIYCDEELEEAINDLQTFLECDLYTKFRPENKLPTGKNNKLENWYRKDFFKNEKQFVEYLNDHFNILRKEIKSLKKNESR